MQHSNFDISKRSSSPSCGCHVLIFFEGSQCREARDLKCQLLTPDSAIQYSSHPCHGYVHKFLFSNDTSEYQSIATPQKDRNVKD